MSGLYELDYMREATKTLDKLHPDVRARILAALGRIRIRPYSFVKRLVGSPCFSFRVDKYRALLDIKESRLLILVIYAKKRDCVHD